MAILDEPAANHRFRALIPSAERKAIQRRLGAAGPVVRAHINEALALVDRMATDPPGHILGRTLMGMGRDLLEAADAVDILIANSAIGPATLQARTVTELLAGIAYLTDRNDERIAVGRQLLMFDQRLDELAEEERKFHRLYPDRRDESVILDRAEALRAARIRFENASHLNRTVRRQIEATAERTGRRVRWYTLFDGPRTLRGLFGQTGLDVIYETAYRPWSEAIHGRGYLHPELLVGPDPADALIPLRDASDEEVARVVAITVTALRSLIGLLAPYTDQDARRFLEAMDARLMAEVVGPSHILGDLHAWLDVLSVQMPAFFRRLDVEEAAA